MPKFKKQTIGLSLLILLILITGFFGSNIDNQLINAESQLSKISLPVVDFSLEHFLINNFSNLVAFLAIFWVSTCLLKMKLNSSNEISRETHKGFFGIESLFFGIAALFFAVIFKQYSDSILKASVNNFSFLLTTLFAIHFLVVSTIIRAFRFQHQEGLYDEDYADSPAFAIFYMFMLFALVLTIFNAFLTISIFGNFENGKFYFSSLIFLVSALIVPFLSAKLFD